MYHGSVYLHVAHMNLSARAYSLQFVSVSLLKQPRSSFSLLPGPSIGSLFHMADDLGRAMESLVSVMTDEQSAEQHEALPF